MRVRISSTAASSASRLRAVERQLELGAVPARVEVRDRDADEGQAAPLDRPARGREQSARRLQHRARGRGRLRQRLRARRAREVAVAQPQHDRAPGPPLRAHAPRDAVDERQEHRVDRLRRLRRPPERALGPERAASATPPHRPRVAPVDERVDVAAERLPEQLDQRRPRSSSTSWRTRVRPLSCSLTAVAGPTPHSRSTGSGFQELRLAVGRDHEQAVGLGRGAGHLGQALVPGHADRDRQADVLAHLAPQPRGDARRRARDALEPAHVEERLVDRQRLDQRCGLLEDLGHGAAGLQVRLPAAA